MILRYSIIDYDGSVSSLRCIYISHNYAYHVYSIHEKTKKYIIAYLVATTYNTLLLSQIADTDVLINYA